MIVCRSIRRARPWAALLLAALPWLPGVASPLPADAQLASDWQASEPFRHYSVADGLSQSAVSVIDQDSAGYLWIGTRRGINRFDGVEFVQYTISDGLPLNAVSALHAAPGGRLWVGDPRGHVSLMRNGKVVRVVDPGIAQGSAIREIVEIGSTVLVATASRGLFEFAVDDESAALKLVRESAGATRDLDSQGEQAWYIQDNTLYRWSADDGEVETLRENVAGTTLGPGGRRWLVDTDGRVRVEAGDDYQTAHRLPEGAQFFDMRVAMDGTVWVATDRGLLRFVAPQAGSTETTAETLYGDFERLNSLFVDREQTLWVGSESKLSRHLGSRFQHYAIDFPNVSATVWNIHQDTAQRLYIGTGNALLRRDPSGETINLTAASELPEGQVRDLYLDEQGILWVGVRGFGVYRLDIDTLDVERLPGTAGLQVLDFEVDSFGILWFSTFDSGLYSVDTADPAAFRQFSVPENASVYVLEIDADDNIWYGIDNTGLAKLARKSRDSFAAEFYGAEYGLDAIEFDDMASVGADRLWIGGENGSLSFFDRGVVVDHREESPLLDQTIYNVFGLPDGAILLGGEQGIYHFNPRTLESRRFGPLQGFVGMETNVHSTYVDPEGYLWVGTIDGPTRMDITTPMPVRPEIVPQIISANAQNSRTALENFSRLDWSERGIQLDFDAVSLQEPFGLQYSFRLAGRDDNWSTPSRIRSVSYSGLAPGNYRFEIRARYPGHAWDTNPAGFQFELLAPFWRQWWFIGLAGLMVAGLLYVAIRARTRQVERMNLRLRAEVDERTRSIERGRARLLESNQQLRQQVEERRRADAARAELEARFRVAFQSTPIGMALIDPYGFLLNSNAALRKMLLDPRSHNDEDVRVSAIDFVDAQYRDRLNADFMRLLKGEVDTLESEYVCRRYDGETLYVNLSLTPVRNEDGKYKYSVAQVQDITESRQLTDALEYQANYDELSGLLNRRSFEQALDRAYQASVGGERSSYLMFMDLDQFKIVNDTSGHTAGDELLRQVSALLRDQVRGDDIVGRLGGDEFGLILWQCPTDVARRIAETIRAAVEDFQFQWDNETYRVGISIGAVPIDASLGNTAEIQQLADAACYQAKDSGRNRVHFAQEVAGSLDEQRGEARWVQRLQYAMDNNLFALYGQLIKPIRTQTKEPERMEILLRMRDPTSRKLIPPGAFLPAAERYGLSVRLDEWVVRSLFKMLYVHEAFGASDRRYWINLSGTSVGDKRFVDFLIDAVKTCGLPEGMINFEITETAVIRNVGEAGRLMSQLHDVGCQFALDDFGSGLSSFGYLKKLPVDYIKIDGMFVRDILTDEIDRIFVRSIIDIARTMDIKTIAEFVENTAILAVVSELGADYVQGFGVHRPELIAPDFPAKPILLDRSSAVSTRQGPPVQEKLA